MPDDVTRAERTLLSLQLVLGSAPLASDDEFADAIVDSVNYRLRAGAPRTVQSKSGATHGKARASAWLRPPDIAPRLDFNPAKRMTARAAARQRRRERQERAERDGAEARPPTKEEAEQRLAQFLERQRNAAKRKEQKLHKNAVEQEALRSQEIQDILEKTVALGGPEDVERFFKRLEHAEERRQRELERKRRERAEEEEEELAQSWQMSAKSRLLAQRSKLAKVGVNERTRRWMSEKQEWMRRREEERIALETASCPFQPKISGLSTQLYEQFRRTAEPPGDRMMRDWQKKRAMKAVLVGLEHGS